MSHRHLFGTLLAAVACAALAPTAPAQNVVWDTVLMKYEPVVGNDINLIQKLKTGEVTVRGPREKANTEYLKKFARTLIYPVTEKQYYVPSSDDFRVRPANENFQNRINDLRSQLIVPTPENRVSQMKLVQGDYVEAFGAALNEAILEVLKKPDMPPVVRINTARLLAEASKSGAPALGKTVQALLDHAQFTDGGKPVDTPPEVLLHALVAAENLLAAYDIRVQNSGETSKRHSIPEDDLMKLLTTLQQYATNGPTRTLKVYVAAPDGSGKAIDLNEKVVPPQNAPPRGPQAGAAAGLLPEQTAVTRFFRRAAIKALAKCRYAVVGGRAGGPDVRPALTLARVAVDDQSIPVPVTPREALEATLGLAGMEPSAELDVPTYMLALATGVRAATAPEAASLDDTTLPAKIAGRRITSAFQRLLERSRNNPRLATSAKAFDDLTQIVLQDIASRIEADATAGAAPDFNRLDTFSNNLPPSPNGRRLFADQAESLLQPRGR